jgi:hypothetical protein
VGRGKHNVDYGRGEANGMTMDKTFAEYTLEDWKNAKTICLTSEGCRQCAIDNKGRITQQGHFTDYASTNHLHRVDIRLLCACLEQKYHTKLKLEVVQRIVMNPQYRSMRELVEALDHRYEINKDIVEKRKKARAAYHARVERWENQFAENGNVVLGIDYKTVDVYDAGFSIWILLNSSVPYEQQKECLFHHPKQWLPFVMGEMRARKKFQKYLDMMPYCKISKISLTRRNEAQVTFELKEGVVEALSSGEK